MCLGACGDNCPMCPRYIATRNNDAGLLKQVLDLYVKIGHREPGTDIESLKCSGCRTNRNCAYPGIRGCVESKRLENCGQCSSYPCDKINDVFLQTAVFRKKISGKISDGGMKMFGDAFYRKKEYLDKIKDDRSAR